MLQKMSNIAVSGQGAANAANFLPLWFSKVFARKSFDEITGRRQNFLKIRNFILDLIKGHEDSYDENNIRDFVDLYIQVSRDSKEERSDVFSQDSMLQVILELFIAGSETTYNTLNWAFLFMAEHPETQARCLKEIDDNVGDKHIEFADRSKMPYIEATISEIQRHGSVVPLSVMHSTSEDTALLGYRIPRKTVVMPSLYSANMDPKYWENPDKFFPDRFLDDMGKLQKCDALLSFSTGPRVCLGEPLAKMELFLIFANLIKRFEFSRENDDVKHSMELKPNQATSAPFPYKLRIKCR